LKKSTNNPTTLSQLAELTGAQLLGDPALIIHDIAALNNATASDITVVLGTHYRKEASKSEAAAFITDKQLPEVSAQLLTSDPRKAMAEIILHFHPNQEIVHPSIHPQSAIHPHAKLHPHSQIDAFTVINENTHIGSNTHIHSHVSIGSDCKIGDNCIIYPQVTIYDKVSIGNNVIIHANTVIGSDGFGFYQLNGEWQKISQIKSVIIDDNVEIGSNTSIDRGCLIDTRIGKGSKIDNLVQISHNTDIGPNAAIAAQVGFTGGTKVGDGVMIGGQVGIDTPEIGEKCIIAAKSGVTKNIKDQQMVSGFPAQPHQDELSYQAYLRGQYRQYKRKKDSQK